MKTRCNDIDCSFGVLTRQIKAVHKDLRDFATRTEKRFKRIERHFDRLDSTVDAVDRKIDGLAKALPGIVGHAVCEPNRGRNKKRESGRH